MYVNHRFYLDLYTQDLIRDMEPNFGFNGFGEFIFYRTYSRTTKEGKQEDWADVVIRVIEGMMSIRKNYYLNNFIPWNEDFWQKLAKDMAISMFNMEWLPPGRGLWAMGTDFVYERGGMALANCGYSDIWFESIDTDLAWIMDVMMLGVGVGFSPFREEGFQFKNPKGSFEYVIPDSREGWVESLKLKFQAYMYGASNPKYIFDEIRPEGLPIKGFGGISSGPEPLKYLLSWIDEAINRYMTDPYYDSVFLKTDCANQIGSCVVSGNVRRSAELAMLTIGDPVFRHLKDYQKYPEREAYGWMSNNTNIFEQDEDFEKIPLLADGNRRRCDIGLANHQNFPKGRIGKRDKIKKDKAKGTNACGEIILENKELCIVDDTFPIRCNDPDIWLEKAVPYATIYNSTVTLLPTHHHDTNKVMVRNRRIGVGICGFVDWVEDIGLTKITKYLRKGYKVVRKTNRWVNSEAGIPESIRVTTVKPNGTTSKLAGVTPGAGYPNFHYMIRRVRVARNSQIHKILVEANIPYEPDLVSMNTDVFEFPIKTNLNVKESGDTSVWEQAMNLIILQREWSDNSVSNTLNFKPKWVLKHHFKNDECIDIESELRKHIYSYDTFTYIYKNLLENNVFEDHLSKIEVKWDDNMEMEEVKIYEYDPRHEEHTIEAVLASIAPVVKTASMLPHTPKGVYNQMPEEEISEEEYHRRVRLIKLIDWSQLSNSEGIDERYCNSEMCLLI